MPKVKGKDACRFCSGTGKVEDTRGQKHDCGKCEGTGSKSKKKS